MAQMPVECRCSKNKAGGKKAFRKKLIHKEKNMLEDLREPIQELKENIMDVWGRL